MSTPRTDEVLEQMRRQTELLEQIARNTAPESPDYKRPLAEFARFDWASIKAVVLSTDRQGPTAVEWNGQQFIRRAGAGKFGQAIWFSRATGKRGDETLYARLLTFKGSGQVEAEPIPF
jgi:hypothetical protein